LLAFRGHPPLSDHAIGHDHEVKVRVAYKQRRVFGVIKE